MLESPLHKSSNPFPIGRIRLRPKINFQKICTKVQKIRTELKERKRNFISRVENYDKAYCIFEGNFIAKLLPHYRKCKKIAKIFACGELNLLDFEQVNVVAPKKIWRNRNGFKERPLQCLFDPFEFKDSLSWTG